MYHPDWSVSKLGFYSKLMGFRTVSSVRDSKRLETTMFRKLVLFLSSGVGGGHLRTETDPVSEK
jgi:hypothetical protein